MMFKWYFQPQYWSDNLSNCIVLSHLIDFIKHSRPYPKQSFLDKGKKFNDMNNSPPVGWEQPSEDKPVVDLELIAAMAQLLPGV